MGQIVMVLLLGVLIDVLLSIVAMIYIKHKRPSLYTLLTKSKKEISNEDYVNDELEEYESDVGALIIELESRRNGNKQEKA